MPYKYCFSRLHKYKDPVILAICLAALFKLADFDYDKYVFKYAVQLSCLGAALLLALARPEAITAWLLPLSPASESRKQRWLIGALGGVFLAGALTTLEIMSPYYFVQEDTNTIFMPVMIEGLRGFFEEGTFPTWNGFNLMGSATTTFGFYALTYPPLYFCYAISRYLLGNEYLTLDMLAWLHLLAGYGLACELLRRLGIRAGLSAAASLTFCLLGYNLIDGRSWYYMLPTITYLPALMIALVEMAQGRLGLRWLITTPLAIGLYFHSGNVQMWCYSMAFWGMGLIVIMASKPAGWRLAYPLGIALVAAAALALPLAVPEFLETSKLPRLPIDDNNIAGGLSNLILPWPLVTSPATWNDDVNPGTLYGMGSMFILLFLARCSVIMAASADARLTRVMALPIYFTAMAVLSFVLALGSQAYLWDFLSSMPPFLKFRMPFRLLPIMGFFMIVSGVFMAEGWLRRKPRWDLEALICVLAIALITFNALHCKVTFDTVTDHPYPTLPENQKPLQANGYTTVGRIAPLGQLRWYGEGSSLALLLNYPALYRIPVTSGSYAEIPEATVPQYRHALRLYDVSPDDFYAEYGVDYVTIARIQGIPKMEEPPEMAKIHTIAQPQHFTYFEAFNIHNQYTKPMAYRESEPQTPLPYHILNNGVDIDIHSLSSREDQAVIANFLYQRWMTAQVDGIPVPIRGDTLGRIAADLTVTGNTLSIRYAPPWYKGSIPALLMLAACVALWRQAVARQS